MNELFEVPNETQAPKPAKPKTTMRMEFYHNGPDCKWPVTQYGLLWDIGHSTERCNLNFGIVDLPWLADHMESAQLTIAERKHLEAVIDRVIELDNPDCMVTFGKWNGMAGTGAHNLKRGVKDMYFGTAAILEPYTGSAPVVHLYHNGVWFTLDSNWKPAGYSSNPAKLWTVKF
jgi:hypothetical protein